MQLLLVLLFTVAIRMQMGACTSYEGYKVYRFQLTEDQLFLLKNFEDNSAVDFWTLGRVADAPIDVMVAPIEQTYFQFFLLENSIRYEILLSDVQVEIDAEKIRQKNAPPRTKGSIEFNQYYQHNEINAYLGDMAAKYPQVASVVTIGQSTEGRDLKVLKISRGGNNPVIWIDAGIHAREWIAPAMALYIINQLLEVPANSALLDGVDWHILPVVNPDGYQFSHTKDRMWRKTRSKNAGCECIGVDANRNWDFHWSVIGASDDCCALKYHGSKPFSEPEIVAIRDHLLKHATNSYVHNLYLTFHSYGNWIMYPWSWTKGRPDNWQVLDKLACKADLAQAGAGGSKYKIGSVAEVLYVASGDSLDWATGVANISLSYVVELPGGGVGGFDLPASLIQKTVREFFAAVVVFGDHVRGASERTELPQTN